jgi:hypothetical protein
VPQPTVPPCTPNYKENSKIYRNPSGQEYGHVERMQNPRMPIQIATAKIDGTRNRGRPNKRWRFEVEDDLNAMEIKNVQGVARDHQESTETVLNCLEKRRISNTQYVLALLGSHQASVFL